MDGVILAGGMSRRMGRPKPFVELEGRPLISWVLESLRPVCLEVFIVANETAPFAKLGCRVVRDLIPDRGPMGGIYTAISSTRERRIFVTGCDTPFLQSSIIRFLSSQIEDYEMAVCRLADGLHPLQAVYTRECLSRMYDCLIAGRLSLIDFIRESRARVVSEQEIDRLDPRRISFLNINTPEDLELATALHRRKRIGSMPGGV